MKNLALSLLLICTFSIIAQADPITIFNFNNLSSTNTALTPSFGNGVLTTNNVGATNFAGTTVNARNGDAAGQSLAVVGGAGNTNNGSFLTLNASTLGFSNIILSFASQRTTTGFTGNQFQYSLDGVNFINFNTFTPAANFATTLFDLSSISGLNNNANAAFRIIFNGATTAAGNNRIDNLVLEGTTINVTPPVQGVPEPATLVLLGTGLSGIVAARRRRKIAQS